MSAAPVDAVLVVPPGIVLDELAEARLWERLAASGPDVAAVAASPAPLAPGTSARVVAEWAACAPPADPVERDQPVDGAVLVRRGVEHRVEGRTVRVEGVVVDEPRAVVHDLEVDPGPPGPAVVEGRPPFPCRPVVVLLATDAGLDRLPWAEALADELLGHDVEARVAAGATAGVGRSTRGCDASPATMVTLRPEVVIALDEEAEGLATRWCEGVRRTVVVRVDAEVRGVSLVSWRLGATRGRTRALVGPGTDAPTIADLVARLAAGPLPGPPTASPQPLLITSARRRVAARPTVDLAVAGDPGDPRSTAFVDLAVGAGWTVRLVDVDVDVDVDANAALGAGLLLVVGATGHGPGLAEVLAIRRQEGSASFVDLRPADLVEGDDPWRARVHDLRPGARPTMDAADAVLVASAALAERAALPPLPYLVVPSWAVDAVATASPAGATPARGGTTEPPVLGWHLGSQGGAAGRATAEVADALAEAVVVALDEQPELRLEIVGAADLPAALFDDERATVVAGPIGPEHLRRWTALVVTPSLAEVLEGEPCGMVGAMAAGVPVRWATPAPVAAPWAPPAALVGDESRASEAWAEVLAGALRAGEAGFASTPLDAECLDALDPATLASALAALARRTGGGA